MTKPDFDLPIANLPSVVRVYIRFLKKLEFIKHCNALPNVISATTAISVRNTEINLNKLGLITIGLSKYLFQPFVEIQETLESNTGLTTSGKHFCYPDIDNPVNNMEGSALGIKKWVSNDCRLPNLT